MPAMSGNRHLPAPTGSLRGPGSLGGGTHLLQGARQRVGMCATSAVLQARCTVSLMRPASKARSLATPSAPCGPAGPWPGCRAPSWIMFRRLSRQYCSTGKVTRSRSRRGSGWPGCWPPGTTAGPVWRWGQHLQQQAGFVGRLRACRVLLVHQQSAVQIQRERRLAVGLCASSMRLMSACSIRRTGARWRPCRPVPALALLD